jgi:uncharacterized membrane protein YecN with MAPEG domain
MVHGMINQNLGKAMLITPLYAAIFGLMFVGLSVRVLLLRQKLGMAIGYGNHAVLARASRVHSNFTEYVPISLILIYFLENQGLASAWIHSSCLALLLGRITHAYGVSQVNEKLIYRVIGMALTLMVIISTSLRLLINYLL